MRLHQKPVRKCHGCPLNLGQHCWVFQYPRGQWRGGRQCRLRGDAEVQGAYRQWCKRPTVKDSKSLRREGHRSRPCERAGEGIAWLRERGFW